MNHQTAEGLLHMPANGHDIGDLNDASELSTIILARNAKDAECDFKDGPTTDDVIEATAPVLLDMSTIVTSLFLLTKPTTAEILDDQFKDSLCRILD